MPNYDLGTAHGRIKIDVDDRSTVQAADNVEAYRLQLERLEKQLQGMSDQLTKIQVGVTNMNKSFNDGSSGVVGFNRNIGNTHSTLGIFNRDIKDTTETLIKFYKVVSRAKDVAAPLQFLARALSETGKQDGNIGTLIKTLAKAGLATAGIRGATNALLGMNKSMANAPTWSRNMNNVGQSLRLAGAASKGLEGLAAKLAKGSEKSRDMATNILVLKNALAPTLKTADDLGKSLRGASTGFNLVKAGIDGILGRFSFLGRIPKVLAIGLGAFVSLVPAALQVFSKALVGASNLIQGLWAGIVQLSGAALALPGALASIGAVIGTLAVITHGLKDQFADLFKAKTLEDANKALAAMDPRFQAVGKSLLALRGGFLSLSKDAAATFIQGLAPGLQRVSDLLKGQLGDGILSVSGSLNTVSRQLLSFSTNAESVGAIRAIFGNASQAVTTFGNALIPALAGLRDLAVVGSQFVTETGAGLPRLTQQFQKWVDTNRDSGQLLAWMRDGKEGAVDLYLGLKRLTEATFSLLTLFKNSNETNFLENFARRMGQFNDAVDKSKATGVLRDIGNAVRNLGTDKIAQAKDLFKSIGDALGGVLPFVETLSQAFSGVFVNGLKSLLVEIKLVTEALHSMGLDQLIGQLAGFYATWKLLPSIFGPVRNAIQTTYGAFLLIRDVPKLLSFVDTGVAKTAGVLGNFGSVGQKLAGSLTNLSGGFKNVLSGVLGFAGPVAVAAVVLGSLYEIMSKGADDQDKFSAQLQQNAKDLDDFGIAVNKAFTADNNVKGKNVTTAVSDGVQKMMDDVKATAENMPGLIDHISDQFGQIAGDPIAQFGAIVTGNAGDTDAINQRQQQAKDAISAQRKLEDLVNNQHVDLGSKVSESDGNYKQFIDNLKAQADGGKEAAAELDKLRGVYQQNAKEAQIAGVGAAQLSEGISKIAESGGNAQTKLDGLKTALQGLGLLQTDSLQAAFALAQEIRNLGTAAEEAATKSGDLSNIIDPVTKGFNTGSVAAQSLFNVLKPLSDGLLDAATHGGDIQKSFADMQPELEKARQSFGLTTDDFNHLLAQLGLGDPKTISILTQLDGKDKTTQDLTEAYLQWQQDVATGINVPVKLTSAADAADIAGKINAIAGAGSATANGSLLYFSPTLSPQAKAAFEADLATLGVNTTGGTTPPAGATPATLPVKPVAVPGANLTTAAGAPPAQAAPAAPAAPPPPVAPATLPPPDTGPTKAALTEAADAFNKFKDAVAQSMSQAREIAEKAIAAISAVLESGSGNAYNDGARIGISFAQGLLDQMPRTEAAARKIAETVNDYIHGRSPTKKGPLSGSGWALYSGERVGQAFADGIGSQSGAVAGQAGNIAGAAGSKLEQGYGSAQSGPGAQQGFLGQLSQLTGFGQHIVDVFSKLAESALSFGKFLSNPQNKEGQFFGKSLGWERDPSITDKQLQDKKDDATQQALTSAADSGQQNIGKIDANSALKDLPKNPTPEQAKTAFVAEAKRRGLSREDTIAGLAAMQNESSSDQTQVNTDAGIHSGLFQMSSDKAGKDSAAGQIDWYLNNIKPGKGLQGAADLENGGYDASRLQPFAGSAAQFYDSVAPQLDALGTGQDGLKNLISPPATGPGAAPKTALDGTPIVDSGTSTTATNLDGTPNVAATAAAAKKAPDNTDALGNLQQTDSIVPQLMAEGNIQNLVQTGQLGRINHGAPSEAGIKQFAQLFGLTESDNSTHAVDGGYHPKGFAFDVNGSQEQMTKFAQFLQDNYRDQLLQLIHDSPNGQEFSIANGRDVGRNSYYADAGNHSDHVHFATDTGFQVTPEILAKIGAVNAGSAGTPDLSKLTADQLQAINSNTGFSAKTSQGMLDALYKQNPLLQQAINEGGRGENVAQSLDVIGKQIDQIQPGGDDKNSTPEQRAQVSALKGQQSTIASQYGYKQKDSPFDQASKLFSAGSSAAGAIFGAIDSGIAAIGGAKNIADTLVRGVSDTEDVFKIVDEVQKFIKFGADVAGAVSSVVSAVGQVAGAAGPADFGASGAISAIGQIAGFVQAGLETANALIDLGQEAYRIIGSYVGDFLGYLTGGPGGPLEGDVKFLLDQQTGQLLTYSGDNPGDKRAHDLIGSNGDTSSRNQQIGNINVYGGPGSDPRDNTRQMMFQVKAAQFSGATAQ